MKDDRLLIVVAMLATLLLVLVVGVKMDSARAEAEIMREWVE